MKPQIIKKEDFSAWVSELAKKNKLIGVKEKESGKYAYGEITNPAEVCMDFDVTIQSPRRYFQLPKEDLLEFKVGRKVKVKPVFESEELTILGVHPYDVKAINQMDKVFTEDNKDTNYTERRAEIAVIGIEPKRASKWAFWCNMNSASVETGWDIWLTDLGDRYYAESKTKKGDKLLKLAKSENAGKVDNLAVKEARLAQKGCNPERHFDVNCEELPKLFKENHENEIWEKNAKKCYSCGSCNLVCPTCYCFDVREELDLSLTAGKRTRYWDGCLLEDFAMVGHGENFREERSARYRHRLLRKMKYMAKKVGDLACVGCGRCASVCLPDIADPVKIINELKN